MVGEPGAIPGSLQPEPMDSSESDKSQDRGNL